MTRIIIAAIVTLVVSGSAWGKEGLLVCAAEQTIGYHYTNGRWVNRSFIPSNKYTIKPVEDTLENMRQENDILYLGGDKPMTHVLQQAGWEGLVGCWTDIDLICEGVLELRLNLRSLRYNGVYRTYTNWSSDNLASEAEGVPDAYFELGSCTKM